MRKTIFSTPVLNTVLHYLAVFLLKLIGWRVVGETPKQQRYILIGAPHTSNWDFALFLLLVFYKRIDVHWMGKHTLFPRPFTGLMKWMGGIAIDRSRNNDIVSQMVLHFAANHELVVAIPPEGTRSPVRQWKTGFYHIAYQADVPIIFGFIDAATKTVGFGESLYPTGNLDTDMIAIRRFYADKQGVRKVS